MTIVYCEAHHQYYNFLTFVDASNFNITYAYKQCEVAKNVVDVGKHRDNLETDCEAST